MRTALRTLVGLSAAGLFLAGTVGTAAAVDLAGWTANPGTSFQDGVVTLDSSDTTLSPYGTSYENTSLLVDLNTNDTVSFEWRSPDDSVSCGGGVPRVFVQQDTYPSTYNTFNGNPDQCGTDTDHDGWSTVTYTYAGPGGVAGYTGIVNDDTSDRGTIQVRNLVISGVNVTGPTTAEGCKNGGWQGAYKNQGACVSSFVKSK